MEFLSRLLSALDLLRPSTWGTLPLDDWIQTTMRQTVKSTAASSVKPRPAMMSGIASAGMTK